MKKFMAIVIVFLFMLSAVPAFAQISSRQNPNPTPNQKAYEHASEKSAFNRVGDWFATLGKSDEEKQRIIAEREAQRAVRRAEKELKHLKKDAGQIQGKTQKQRSKTQRSMGR
jgi:hypothetical protein